VLRQQVELVGKTAENKLGNDYEEEQVRRRLADLMPLFA